VKRNVAAANAFNLIKMLSNPWFAHRKHQALARLLLKDKAWAG